MQTPEIKNKVYNWFSAIMHTCHISKTVNKDNQAGLFVPNRQVSLITALALGLLFFVFLMGYFYGQRKAIERFVNKIEEESFADRISYALYTMNDRESSEFEDADSETENAEIPSETGDSAGDISGDGVSTESEGDVNEQVDHVTQTKTQGDIKNQNISVAKAEQPEFTSEIITVFNAEIAGFGSAQAAHKFMDRAEEIDSRIQLKKRMSCTKSGKKIVWYQAVAQDFENKAELEKLVEEIKKKEMIKTIVITEKRKVC